MKMKKKKQGEKIQDKEYHKEYKMKLNMKQKQGEKMQDKEHHKEYKMKLKGCGAPSILNWFGFGTSDDSKADIERSDNRRQLKHHFRVIGQKDNEHRNDHTNKYNDHYNFDSEEYYDTYYVKIPPAHSDHNKNIYDHSEGVDIWELPPLWNGHVEIPNLVPKKKKKDGHLIFGGDIDTDERVVKGWDNRWGFRLSIPYIGDFQYLREMGPGDFVPKLGPGKFQYPGPGEVDDYGHKAYDPYEGYTEPQPGLPIIDLTEYHGLQNYPWYSR